MKTLRVIAIVSGLALLALLWLSAPEPVVRKAPAAPHAASNSFALRDVRVFDGEGVIEAATVVVKDGLIDSVGAQVTIPAGVAVIDGKGKTLLPALIDAHVHSWGQARQQTLRFGVGTSLDMFTDPSQLPAMRRDRESLSATDQADLWSAGALITAKGGHGTQFGVAIDTLDSIDDAASRVEQRIAQGSDYIKLVYDNGQAYGETVRFATLDLDQVKAVIAAAHAGKRMAVVHVAQAQAAREVVDAGADGLVHVYSDRIAEGAVVDSLREHRAFVIPTLSVMASLAGDATAAQLLAEPALAARLDAAQRASLESSFPEGWRKAQHLNNALANVRALHAAGVDILAGTDAGNPGTAHGASMHGELELLVRAGLTPAQALRAATALPARRFGLRDRGRIAPGLRADLLLVNGDPTRDIRASRSIEQVWKNGFAVASTRAETAPAAAALTALHHDFEHADNYLQVNERVQWRQTSDQMFGGQSSVSLSWTAEGAESGSGALQVSGTINTGAAFPWAGAMLFFDPQPMRAMDARGLRQLRFFARGDGRAYQLMLFSGAERSQPLSQAFVADAQWREQRIDLATFPGLDLAQLRAIAFTAGQPQGEFELMIDQVRLE